MHCHLRALLGVKLKCLNKLAYCVGVELEKAVINYSCIQVVIELRTVESRGSKCWKAYRTIQIPRPPEFRP